MRIWFGVAALSLVVLLALPSASQNVSAPSDAEVCYHGAAGDPATDAACARLQEEASQPIVRPAPPKPPAAVAAASNLDQGVPPVTASAAQPPPTDVGETPVQPTAAAGAAAPPPAAAPAGAEGQNADEANSVNVSVHPSWLWGFGPAMVGVFALAAFAGLVFYFLPTIVAASRRKGNTPAIFILNLLLGWTFVGWVVALVWSLTAEPAGRRS